MDIQWLIIARAYSIDREGCLDIGGICQRIAFDAPPYRASFVLLAKIQATPLEVGDEKRITVRIAHEFPGLESSFDVRYRVPDLSAWAVGRPFIAHPFTDFEFPRAGEYVFELAVDGEVKNQESITILERRARRPND